MSTRMPLALTVIVMLFTSLGTFAGTVEGPGNIPNTNCDADLVRKIYEDNNERLMTAIDARFVNKTDTGGTDARFCGWLDGQYNGDTEADFDCKCNEPNLNTPELENSGINQNTREHIREVANPPMQSQSIFGDSKFWLGAGLGGIVGFLAKGLLDGRDDRRERRERRWEREERFYRRMQARYGDREIRPYLPGYQYQNGPTILGAQQQQLGAFPSVVNANNLANYQNAPAVLPIQQYSVWGPQPQPQYSLTGP